MASRSVVLVRYLSCTCGYVALTLQVVLLFTTMATTLGLGASNGGRPKINYTVTENDPPRTLIGNVGYNAGLYEMYSEPIRREMRYRWLGDETYQDLFSISEDRGELYTEQVLDRESLCEQQAVCQLVLRVAVQPVPEIYMIIIQVTIDVLDINDNSPQFRDRIIHLTISESALPGVTISAPLAVDADPGRHGVRMYRLYGYPETFQLLDGDGADGSRVRLELLQPLDREVKENYTMSFIASDGGRPPRTGNTTLVLTVLDANDHHPEFEQSSYEIAVREDTVPGTPLTTVRATDADVGRNARITYTFSRETSSRSKALFSIHNATGVITIADDLDFETMPEHVLHVTAVDGGSDPVEAHATVTVELMDVNDHAPETTINIMSDSGQVEVQEEQEGEQFVTHISVEDLDSGSNGEVTCELVNGTSDFYLELVYTNEYRLMSNKKFDRETQARSFASVECSDNGTPPLHSRETFPVIVTDQNDHAPHFSQYEYMASIDEGNELDVPVLQVDATDMDIGENGRVTYILPPNIRPLFNIDHSGTLFTKTVFDHEVMDRVSFFLTATDHGDPQKSAIAQVVLQITDINDEPPVFNDTSYVFGVYEDRSIGTEVGRIKTTDADDYYRSVSYNLRSTSAFAIDTNTGIIRTRRRLDRESQSSYTFEVWAHNPGPPTLSSSATVTVYVVDINDHAPRIHFPRPGNNTVQVPAYIPVRLPLTTVVADDSDAGVNAKLNYEIAKGNEDGIFVINRTSGTIAVTSRKDDGVTLTRPEYDLLISVRDSGESPQTASENLLLVVNHSLVYTSLETGGHVAPLLGSNSTLAVIVGAVAFVLIVLLVTAIICVKRRQARRSADEYKHMCRVEAMPRVTADGPASRADVEQTINKDGKNPQKSSQGRCVDKRDNEYNNGTRNGGWSATMRSNQLPSSQYGVSTAHSPSHAIPLSNLSSSVTRSPSLPTSPSNAPQHDFSSLKRPTTTGPSHGPQLYGPPQAPRPPPPRYRLIDGTGSPLKNLTHREMEVHKLLQLMSGDAPPASAQPPADTDSTSGCSADGTDSGRGGSEEGDMQMSSANMQMSQHGGNMPTPAHYEALCSRRRPCESDYSTAAACKSAGPGITSPRALVNSGPLTDSGPSSTGMGRPTGPYPVNVNPVNVQCTCGALNKSGRPLPLQQKPSHKPYCHCIIYGPTGRPGPQPSGKKPTPCDSSSGEHPDPSNQPRSGVISNGYTTYPPRPNTHTHGGRQQVDPTGLSPHTSSTSRLGDPESNETYYVPSALPGHVNNPRSHRSRPHWTGSTFGRPLPMTVLGRVEETEDGISDSSSTTTSGSFDVDPEACLEQRMQVDVNGRTTASPINSNNLRHGGSTTNINGTKSNTTHSFV